MVDQRNPNVDPQEWLAEVSDALRKSMFGRGREIAGLVCDREQSGLLLDVYEPDPDSEGYAYLPWSSR